jgi:ABC-2 type transport system ATP-binding protein
VRLATALVHSPELVFLDEPTSGMDPDGREQMLALIRDLAAAKGISVVVSTHILHDVEACCDAVIILAKGRLLKYERLETLQRTVDPWFAIRVGERAAELASELERRGLQVERRADDELRVAGNGDLAPAILRAVRERGLSLREMTPARNSLQEIFLRALRGPDADS